MLFTRDWLIVCCLFNVQWHISHSYSGQVTINLRGNFYKEKKSPVMKGGKSRLPRNKKRILDRVIVFSTTGTWTRFWNSERNFAVQKRMRWNQQQTKHSYFNLIYAWLRIHTSHLSNQSYILRLGLLPDIISPCNRIFIYPSILWIKY